MVSRSISNVLVDKQNETNEIVETHTYADSLFCQCIYEQQTVMNKVERCCVFIDCIHSYMYKQFECVLFYQYFN